jgi:hypothetical protein
MRTFTTSFIAQKNAGEGRTAWCQLVDISLPNSTARFTSFPETITYAGNVYMPVPMRIGEEEQATDGSLPQLSVIVANVAGLAYKFANENDMSGRRVTLRLVNTAVSTGDDSRAVLYVRGCTFTDEVGSFELGLPFDFEAEGPRRTYNRRDFPGIPFSHRAYGLV